METPDATPDTTGSLLAEIASIAADIDTRITAMLDNPEVVDSARQS